jgi:hypothetical protein
VKRWRWCAPAAERTTATVREQRKKKKTMSAVEGFIAVAEQHGDATRSSSR